MPIPPPIPAKLLKKIKEISKYFKKIENPTPKKSYTQVSFNHASKDTTSNVAINTLKIKKTFPDLLNKKINTIQKVINEKNDKLKPRINMTTKGPSHKQVIVLISNKLGKKFTKDSASHIININHVLKNIKSNICADFIISDSKGIIITTNNIASNSDLLEIEKYVKNLLEDNNNTISSLKLPQSKSYLKIVAIPYYIDNSNMYISSENIKCILKNNYIFNNIILALRSCIIKVSFKSDMAVV